MEVGSFLCGAGGLVSDVLGGTRLYSPAWRLLSVVEFLRLKLLCSRFRFTELRSAGLQTYSVLLAVRLADFNGGVPELLHKQLVSRW